MFVPAGSPIFFLREHRFAVRCRVVTLRQLLWTLFTLLFMLSTCLLHIFLYIFFINIGCATLYHLSMMYVTVYNMSFNSNCRILAAELNYRFTNCYYTLNQLNSIHCLFWVQTWMLYVYSNITVQVVQEIMETFTFKVKILEN